MLIISEVRVYKEMSGKELYDFFHSPLFAVLSNEIEQRKEEDPNEVDQMPV